MIRPSEPLNLRAGISDRARVRRGDFPVCVNGGTVHSTIRRELVAKQIEIHQQRTADVINMAVVRAVRIQEIRIRIADIIDDF